MMHIQKCIKHGVSIEKSINTFDLFAAEVSNRCILIGGEQ
jgi:hypothetical protein